MEAQVLILANDRSAIDFAELAKIENINGYYQAANIPSNTGVPIEYLGSTTVPSYNEKASPLQVSRSVRPEVAMLDINSVSKWCDDNMFNKDHAHGVRNLVTNPRLLSPITDQTWQLSPSLYPLPHKVWMEVVPAGVSNAKKPSHPCFT
ncbi:MAG: hypothetical protein ACJAX5_000698 [Patiriisocius sp.]